MLITLSEAKNNEGQSTLAEIKKKVIPIFCPAANNCPLFTVGFHKKVNKINPDNIIRPEMEVREWGRVDGAKSDYESTSPGIEWGIKCQDLLFRGKPKTREGILSRFYRYKIRSVSTTSSPNAPNAKIVIFYFKIIAGITDNSS